MLSWEIAVCGDLSVLNVNTCQCHLTSATTSRQISAQRRSDCHQKWAREMCRVICPDVA